MTQLIVVVVLAMNVDVVVYINFVVALQPLIVANVVDNVVDYKYCVVVVLNGYYYLCYDYLFDYFVEMMWIVAYKLNPINKQFLESF